MSLLGYPQRPLAAASFLWSAIPPVAEAMRLAEPAPRTEDDALLPYGAWAQNAAAAAFSATDLFRWDAAACGDALPAPAVSADLLF